MEGEKNVVWLISDNSSLFRASEQS